jgi:hypothetical protein
MSLNPPGQARGGPKEPPVGPARRYPVPAKTRQNQLPAGDEEAIFKHYGLAYEPGAGGERRLARR